MGIVIKLSDIRQRREACTDILCETIVFHGRFSWSTKVCLKLFVLCQQIQREKCEFMQKDEILFPLL